MPDNGESGLCRCCRYIAEERDAVRHGADRTAPMWQAAFFRRFAAYEVVHALPVAPAGSNTPASRSQALRPADSRCCGLPEGVVGCYCFTGDENRMRQHACRRVAGRDLDEDDARRAAAICSPAAPIRIEAPVSW